MTVCRSCGEGDTKLYQCDRCSLRECKECAGVSASEERALDLKKDRKIMYYCRECKSAVETEPTNLQLIERVNKIEDLVTKIYGELDTLKKENQHKANPSTQNQDMVKYLQEHILHLEETLRLKDSIIREKNGLIREKENIIKEKESALRAINQNSIVMEKTVNSFYPFQEKPVTTISEPISSKYSQNSSWRQGPRMTLNTPSIPHGSDRYLLQYQERHHSARNEGESAKQIQGSRLNENMEDNRTGITENFLPTTNMNIKGDNEWKSPRRTRRRNKGKLGEGRTTEEDRETGLAGRTNSKDKKIWLHISRVRDHVTEKIVVDYLVKKTQLKPDDFIVSNLKIKKETPNNKCFLVGVKPDLKDTVYDPLFWPEGIAHARFDFRRGQHFLDQNTLKLRPSA